MTDSAPDLKGDITMGNRHYMCTVSSNSNLGNEYLVRTRSAMDCAEKYGRCEQGESVTVRTLQGKPLSRVLWSDADRKYYRVNI